MSVAQAPAQLVANSALFDEPVTLEGARAFLRREGHVLLLAIAPDGTGIGFVSGVETHHPDKAAEMFVHELGVDERWRRRGVATSLLLALHEEAERRGCVGVWTATEADNSAALATYRSLDAAVDEETVIIAWDAPIQR